MRIFKYGHSTLCNCYICRLGRKELSAKQLFILITLFFGALISAVAFWK